MEVDPSTHTTRAHRLHHSKRPTALGRAEPFATANHNACSTHRGSPRRLNHGPTRMRITFLSYSIVAIVRSLPLPAAQTNTAPAGIEAASSLSATAGPFTAPRLWRSGPPTTTVVKRISSIL